MILQKYKAAGFHSESHMKSLLEKGWKAHPTNDHAMNSLIYQVDF